MIKSISIALIAFSLGSWVGYLATMKHIEMKLEAFATKAKLQQSLKAK